MNDQRTGLIIVVSAPSGGGKSSLCQRLLNWSSNLGYSVSCTTRAPRGGEVNGRDYFFLSRDEFESKIAAGEFLEHAEYNGNYYGTPRAFIEEQLTAGRDVLLDVEVQGAGQLMQSVRHGRFAYPEALVMLFLMPPSLELLETRLRRRGTDSDETIRKRLGIAEREMAHWIDYDYVIVSGKLDDDFAQGKAIIIAEKCRASPATEEQAMAAKRTILLGVTGSIAAYKSADLASQLTKAGHTVHCVMTKDAAHFITPLTLQTLSQNPVTLDLFGEDKEWKPSHLQVADVADLLLIAPATANVIAKLALGLADDALSTIALALRPEAKTLIAPAMNGKMWLHPATQANVKTLTDRGVGFIGPDEGMLACGYEGIGRLWPVEKILTQVLATLS